MKRPKVYVSRPLPQDGIELLKESCEVEVNPEDRPLSREEFLEKISGRDGVLCLLHDRIDAEVFDAVPGIKGFANYAVGYDNIDVKEATRRGIPISNTPGVLTDATAEMAWALLFAIGRRVVESDRVMRSGNWPGWGPLQFLGGDVAGATLGIIGAGRIGTAMALKSKGFRMQVLYYDVRPNETLEKELGARKVELDELLRESDFISIHTPLMPETRHLITLDQIKKMKSTAYLINTSRGPVIRESDLLKALQQEIIAGAAIDVYEFEPEMTPGLEKLDNIVITPHTASGTIGSRTNMALKAAANLVAMVRGEKAPDCVNPEVYG
ncbi:MAG: D-glycerate dehydrogenase [Spirochaetota bacterium]|nr:D-glycerate dehydrogenase [Spirochaetota bacterium]